MAQPTEQTLLEKLLQTRYPLTNYLCRQQEFIKAYSNTSASTIAAPTPPPEPARILANKSKVSLPPPPCFNVPDTLDFNASENEMEDNDTQAYDEKLLLKSIDNRINDSSTDIINEKNSSILKRSSGIKLEFSPYQNNSPVQKAIQNGLNIINE